MKASEIKKKFLEFFKSKGHTIVPSSSLLPVGDPTLLFTTAGMVQFKPFFTGAVELPYTRAASSQKCLRTTDLENVGKTERHCTFFEMLGNFSFGDYFKKEAIEYALEFSTQHLGFPIEKIWITVYLDDDEALEYWVEAGIPRERIVKLGKKDNFWGPAGDSGACGPCSELYLDRGLEKGRNCLPNSPTCKPGCDCDRFLEFWNLVFNQYNQDVNGVLHPLAQTGIDTGSGLERVALLLQNVDSVYDTDELSRIIQKIEKLTNQKYEGELKPAFRVLTDHSRAITFAICDGILPDKTGRGYVIRRLIRRACLYARKLQIKEPFIYKLISEIVEIYKEEYPELLEKQAQVEKIVELEEKLFLNTLEIGLLQMESMISQYQAQGKKLFSGVDAFKLYGTFGFPKEMTKEILEEYGLEFDEKGFEVELEKDRNLSRETWKGKKTQILTNLEFTKLPATQFLGYTTLESPAVVIGLVLEDRPTSILKTGESGIIILNQTPFYAEAGGQIGDTGFIKANNFLFQVLDTQKENDIYLHIGVVLSGEIFLNSEVLAGVEEERRELLTYHHSGTHLLHSALREILGKHVSQKASLVSNEYLRFDFSHPNPMNMEEILSVEEFVNKAIVSSVPVDTKIYELEEAKKTGAIAFFEEKYGDKVRVVSMGEFSSEFCGGCHVSNTSQIGAFLIKKESSPGAGNRRIEAICGPQVEKYFQEEFQNLGSVVNELNLKLKEVFDTKEHFISYIVPTPEEIQKEFKEKGSKAVKIFREKKAQLEKIISEKKNLLHQEKKKKEQALSSSLLSQQAQILEKAQNLGKIQFVVYETNPVKIELLKELGDSLKNKLPNLFFLAIVKTEEVDTLLMMAGKEAVKFGVNCNNLLKQVLLKLDGRGGGKPDLAQGSCKKRELLSSAIEDLKSELQKL